MILTIGTGFDSPGRWIAEVLELPEAIVYGTSKADAVAKVEALARLILADRIRHGEQIPGDLRFEHREAELRSQAYKAVFEEAASALVDAMGNPETRARLILADRIRHGEQIPGDLRFEHREAELRSQAYKAVFEPESDGGFSVYVPDLPGCASQGDTYEEALANIADAVQCYVLSMRDDGLPVPPPRARVETVIVDAA
jgi:antitoxin HicB